MSRVGSAFSIVDFLCAAVFACGVIIFAQVGKPYKRGFFCNDESIQKPYKDSTITSITAVSVGFTLVLVVVVVTELLLNHLQKTGRVTSDTETYSSASCSSKIPPVIKSIIWVACICLYGAAMNQFLTDVGKYSIGRLRPHFLDVCKPDWSKFNCTDKRGNYVFIVDDFCTVAEGTHKAKQSRLSFPSGHSSFSGIPHVSILINCIIYYTYDLRKKNLCKLPKAKTIPYEVESLSFRGSFLWNTLDDNVKQELTLARFKNKIRNWAGEPCTCRICC